MSDPIGTSPPLAQPSTLSSMVPEGQSLAVKGKLNSQGPGPLGPGQSQAAQGNTVAGHERLLDVSKVRADDVNPSLAPFIMMGASGDVDDVFAWLGLGAIGDVTLKVVAHAEEVEADFLTGRYHNIEAGEGIADLFPHDKGQPVAETQQRET